MTAGFSYDVAASLLQEGSALDGTLAGLEALLHRAGGVRTRTDDAPLDRPLLVVEEAIGSGGLAGAVLEAASARHAGSVLRIKALGLPDSPVSHGDAARLRHAYGLDAVGIVAAARTMLVESHP